jgi:hypothetical protein
MADEGKKAVCCTGAHPRRLIVVWLVRALMQQHDTIQASRLCDRKTQARRTHNRALHTASCIRIAQFPIENHSEQGQSAELPLKQ